MKDVRHGISSGGKAEREEQRVSANIPPKPAHGKQLSRLEMRWKPKPKLLLSQFQQLQQSQR
jgi:hypothetical protein